MKERMWAVSRTASPVPTQNQRQLTQATCPGLSQPVRPSVTIGRVGQRALRRQVIYRSLPHIRYGETVAAVNRIHRRLGLRVGTLADLGWPAGLPGLAYLAGWRLGLETRAGNSGWKVELGNLV